MAATHRLGSRATGAELVFVQGVAGGFGVEIRGAGGLRLFQPQPVGLEVFVDLDDTRQFAASYETVESGGDGLIARSTLALPHEVSIAVQDHWSVAGKVIGLRRELRVCGSSSGGFASRICLTTRPQVAWDQVQLLAPSVLYGWPVRRTEHPARGFQQADAEHYTIREDALAAPMLAALFPDGCSFTMLDVDPQGDTTVEEVGIKQASVMLDERYSFGALGAFKAANGGAEICFSMPGSMGATGRFAERRRYSRIIDGHTQGYTLALRLGQEESYRELVRNAWRWAWQTLAPPVNYIDLDVARRALVDQLADTVATCQDRTAITWIFSSRTGRPWSRPDDTRAAMGFVGKNIEAADQLLREADREDTERSKRLRDLGLAIIDSYIRLVPLDPPVGEGFDLLTGEPTVSFPPSPWRGDAPARVFLRAPSEDLRMLLRAYAREKAQGRVHPTWLRWVRSFCSWLLPQQRPDGSFPRAWVPGTGEVMEASGTASYNPVPMLVLLTEITGQFRYLEAALRAAEHVWQDFGSQGVFVGGTLDNPDVVDKEAGMLALEAFLSLYEADGDAEWLTRAQVAADFAETFIWIWNVPMPLDATDGELRWKHGVPTYGLQGITANPGGGVDQYMDWSAPAYAKLYAYTGDEHYRQVALVLLHDTKAMLALPGRTFDLAGPGWQQEHWNMALMRGIGGHGGWLPWVTTNHLYSITGLEDVPGLYDQLSRPDEID